MAGGLGREARDPEKGGARSPSGGSNRGSPSRSGATGGLGREARDPEKGGARPASGPGSAPTSGKVTEGRSSALPTGVTPLNQPKPMGAVPYVSEPSLGQILGEVLGAALGVAAPGAGVVNSVAGSVNQGTLGDFSAISRGGIIGQGIDAVFGGVPGQQTGWSADRNHGVPGDIGGSGGAVNDGPLVVNRAGTVERTSQGGDAAPISESLRTILSQAGVWPPVKAAAV